MAVTTLGASDSWSLCGENFRPPDDDWMYYLGLQIIMAACFGIAIVLLLSGCSFARASGADWSAWRGTVGLQSRVQSFEVDAERARFGVAEQDGADGVGAAVGAAAKAVRP